MILATTLVFLFGGLLGWLYGKRRGRSDLIELRRQMQIGRIGTSEQQHRIPKVAVSEALNSTTTIAVPKYSPVSSSTKSTTSSGETSHIVSIEKDASVKPEDKNWVGAGEQDFDELYKIAGRVKPLEFELKQSWLRVAELEKSSKQYNDSHAASLSNPSTSSSQAKFNLDSDSSTSSKAVESVEQDAGEMDELYRISARVKPLEYDLTQRKIEVRALKQALQDMRRINDKQLVSVRLQAENQANLQFKEKLTEKQQHIDSLQTKLSNTSKSKSQNQELQARVERVESLERERDQLQGQSESQLGNIRALTEQCNMLEAKTKTQQHELTELKNERSNISGSIDHFNTQIARREKQLDELREKQFLLDQKNQDYESINVRQDRELTSTKKQLVGTRENLTQSEKRVAELHKEVSGLNQKLNSRSNELEALQLSFVEQQERLDKIPALEASVLNSQQELQRVKKSAVHIDSLQARLVEKDEQIVSLQKQTDRVVSLELVAKTRDAQIRKLSERGEQVEGLEKQLLEKERKIAFLQRLEVKVSDQEGLIKNLKNEYDRTVKDKTILENTQLQLRKELANTKESVKEVSRVRAELVKCKKAEAQLAQIQNEIIKARQMKADLVRLRSAANELEQSRAETENLRRSLEKAESAVMASKQNDIELRRLRSEMQSLQSIRDNQVNKVRSLERQIHEHEQQIVNNRQLKERVRELESVEAENVNSNQQIAELKSQLLELRNDHKQNVTSPKKQTKKTKSRMPLSPLYVAPAEKDDLKKINGIGPVIEKMLNSLGVTSFKQVAEFKPDDITTVTEAIEAFPGRIERDNWVGGAKEQYAKKYLNADA